MNSNTIKIILCDDHFFLREGLKKILKEESGMKITGEASNAAELITLLKKTECDILILDISLPDKNGLEILLDVKVMFPLLKVLFLSMHPEDRFALRAFKTGAWGYLTKESAPDELVKAIHTILSGKKYVTKALAEKLVDIFADDTGKQPHELLSNREYEIFIKLTSGSKVSEIASNLNISVNTVNTYRARVLEKMNVRSNVELTQYALKHNLID